MNAARSRYRASPDLVSTSVPSIPSTIYGAAKSRIQRPDFPLESVQ